MPPRVSTVQEVLTLASVLFTFLVLCVVYFVVVDEFVCLLISLAWILICTRWAL